MKFAYAPARLIRPTGPIFARWIGAIQDTRFVNIRYWKLEPVSGRYNSVMTLACYCREHCILYLESDFPSGCPECNRAE